MMMTEKQRYTKWEEYTRMVLAGTLIKENEDERTKAKRKAKLEADPEEWFNYYFPRFSYAKPAKFHKKATRRILRNKEWCEVRLWSRELAKSTRTMMEVFYLVFVGHTWGNETVQSPADTATDMKRAPIPAANETAGPEGQDMDEESAEAAAERKLHEQVTTHKGKRCILLISNSLDNATRLLMPYKANLEFNKRLIQDYGDQVSDGTWNASEFITTGGISFRAIGVGQSPRGTRNEEARPDILLFDDVDTDADCLNPETVARKWRWIEEAAIGTRSVSVPTTIIFCGNKIANDSCIQRATGIADKTDIKNIRNADGLSSWPEKNGELEIDRVLGQKSYAAQQKEYYNNPIIEGSVFKEMAYKPARPMKDYELLVCYTDPSYKTTGDYKATVLVGKWRHEFHVIRCFLDHASTAQMIEWHYKIMDQVGDRACYYFMEDVFIQDVLLKEVSDAGKRLGRPIPLNGDRRRKPDKFTRIESLLEPLHRNGELYLCTGEKDNMHMQRLEKQFTALAPGSHANDDGPDAVEGAVWMIIDKMHKKDTTGIQAGLPRVNVHRY